MRKVLNVGLAGLTALTIGLSPISQARTIQTDKPDSRELGKGWDEVICIGCVAAGTVTLLSGAAGWGILIANAEATAVIVVGCINACKSALDE
jgi:hypothetical protein